MKRILLVKVPTYEYPEDVEASNAAELVVLSYYPSLALAWLTGYVARYFTGPYQLDAFDMNAVTIGHKGTVGDAGRQALAAVEKKIAETEFDIFAVSNQFLFSQPYADHVIELAKQKNPKAIVVVGGAFATIFPEKAINKPHVDYVVIGEGEHTFVHILNRIYGIEDKAYEERWPFDGYGIKNAHGRVELVRKNKFLDNLDDLPAPVWNFAELDDYVAREPNAFMPFMASRGCPMNCSFCSTHLSWGKPVRYRPAVDVVAEIMAAHERYGFKRFHCVDDNVTFSEDWFVEFCERLSQVRPPELSFTFSNFDMRFLSRAVLRGLKQIGVKSVTIATESGTPEIQKQISKKLNLDRVREVVKTIHSEGMFVHNCFIIGFPTETIEQMHQTVAFARELRTESMQIWPAFPFPGTRLYAQAKALGFVSYDEDDYGSLKYRKGGIATNEWDVETVQKIAYDANIELNFLSTPLYDTENGRMALKAKVDGVASGIKGHAVACVVGGYLAKGLGDEDGRDERYDTALGYLLEGDCIYRPYMTWDFPAIADFRAWVAANRPDRFDAVFLHAENDGEPMVEAGTFSRLAQQAPVLNRA